MLIPETDSSHEAFPKVSSLHGSRAYTLILYQTPHLAIMLPQERKESWDRKEVTKVAVSVLEWHNSM